MVSQTEFTLRPRTRGFHLITDEVVRNLPPLPQTGLLICSSNILVRH